MSQSQPKVCITTLEFPPDVGGVGESVQRISQMLIESGYEVHVAVFRSKQRFAKDGLRRRASCDTTIQNEVFVHRIDSAIRDGEGMIYDFYSDVYFYLKKLHQKYRFDLLHGFFLNETGYVTTLLSKEEDIPVINSVRGSDLHKHIFNPKVHPQAVWILENSAWSTFVSKNLQKRGIAIAPSIKDKCSAFLNSIKPIDFDNLEKPALLQELSGIIVGSTGRFRDKKGMEYLLEACAKVSQNIDLTLLLVGDFVDKERAYWEKEIQASNIGDRLKITGIVSRQEVLAYLPHFDIFAIPSLHDGCPNALLEAMLAGNAIVGSNVDAIGEILADGTSGLTVEPANTEDLARAIETLANHPKLRQKFGRGAREKVLTELSPNIEKANWLAVYQKAMGKNVSPELITA
jgi:L-malate glycosyltransferase